MSATTRNLSLSSPSGEWATISRTRTKKAFFSIRWKILIAFLLILVVAFYVVATSLITLVSNYLFQTRIDTETSTVEALAVSFADILARGDADTLFEEARKASSEYEARLLILDMDGKVQIDTSSEFNGWRIGHPEVVSVLKGADSDYGFHQIKAGEYKSAQSKARFDFLRKTETDKQWVGYFVAPLISGANRLGAVLYSVQVQDVVDNLRVMQDQMLVYFLLAAVAVFITGLIFSSVITKPVAALTEGIKRMARGDFSSRVKVGGRDEMARLAETFNQMSEKLESLDMSRNAFVSNASHELKTPLATMKIMLESVLYQEDMEPGLRAEFLSDINNELDRLSQIVTDLLTLVQVDTNDYQLMRKDILLRELVKDTIRRLEPLAKQNGQQFEFKAQSDCPIFADPVKLQQAIYNLIDNAVKYSPKSAKIRVFVRQEGKNAVFEVTDTGPGIPKKDQAHIFDRFYRVDKARSRATGGNGLGLSIVHQMVMLHDGSVSVRSEEGKGATFRMELPM